MTRTLLPAPLTPRGVRYARTGEYRRCAGIDCGAIKPAKAFARESGHGHYHFCDTCRGGAPDPLVAAREAKRAAKRAEELAAEAARETRRQARLARRFWLRQLQQRARASA